MEAVNHWGLSRAELNEFIEEKKLANDILFPNDGDTYSF